MPSPSLNAQKFKLATSVVALVGAASLSSQAVAQTGGQAPGSMPGNAAAGINPADTPKVTPGRPPVPAPSADQVNAQAKAQDAPKPAATQAAPDPAALVRHITVQGNERIETATILSYLPVSVGDTADATRIDAALKTLARTELFSDERIELDPKTGDLMVRVIENPIINQVVFEGNSALSTDKLKDEVSIHPRSIFTKSHILQDVQRIVELYRRSGRIAVVVTPKIVQLPQRRVDLVFEIS